MKERSRGVGNRVANVAAKTVIMAAATVFLALLWLNLTNFMFYDDSLGDLLYFFGAPALLAIATISLLLLPAEWRIVVASCFVAILPGLYGAELYLTLTSQDAMEEIAAARGEIVDRRSKLEVILALRSEGKDAYPTVRAKDLLIEGPGDSLVSPIVSDGKPLLPLATVPDRTVVSCNEIGEWLVYRSDRHGFHNPPGVWESPPRVMLVGDSFVHGDCVPSNANLGALLRDRYGSVINLGVAGFGPLSNLASLKEYASRSAPPVVLWFFFEGNDLTKDLPREKRSDILLSYLRPDFDQKLATRQQEMARSLAAYLDRHMEEAMSRIDHSYEPLIDFLQLYRLRERFGLDAVGLGVTRGRADEETFALFSAILTEAKRTVATWGGRLYLVYLPDSTRYLSWSRHTRVRNFIRRRVLDVAGHLRVPVIDIHESFAARGKPIELFHYPGSHYNEAGYSLVAQVIARRLDKSMAMMAPRRIK